MRQQRRGPSYLRRLRLWASLAALTPLSALLISSETENAIANGDTRTLSIYHVHTKETTTVTFRVNGVYDSAALEKLNWALRDWRRDEPTKMDPRLFDVVWEVYREAGANQPVWILSAYRSPETNAMLRRRSRQVAEFSQHMLGKAMDTHMPDMPMQKVRDIAMRLQRGGVGYYPTAGTPFVHIDVGNVRYWPRMSRYEMARIFPDGKTVDIPADGQPMPRYNEALAEIQSRGGASAYVASAETGKAGSSFLARLFGSGEDEDAAVAAPTNNRGVAPAAAVARGASVPASSVIQVSSAATVTRGSPFAWQQQLSPTAAPAPAAPAPAPTVVANAQPTAPARLEMSSRPAQPQLTGLSDPTEKSDAIAPIILAMAAKTDVPMPPRRPSDLVADAVPVPMPPSRPVDLVFQAAAIDADRRATAASALMATAVQMAPASRPESAAPTPRSVPLPSVITQGTAKPAAQASAALAFAEIPPPAHPALAPSTKVNIVPPPFQRRASAASPKPELVAARLNRSNFRILIQSAPTATETTYAALGAGSALTPLRAAARAATQETWFAPSASAASRFGREVASDLSSDRFSGPAVRALADASTVE